MTPGRKNRSSRAALFFNFFAKVAVGRRNFGVRTALTDRQWDRAGQEMSRLIAGISGALALSLISGAAEFARGRDLPSVAGNTTPATQSLFLPSSSPTEGATPVNRGSKADRAAAVSGSPASTRTISLKLNGLSDTTVLVRLSVTAGTPSTAPSPAKPNFRRPMVACEPDVSVLTEVAKQLLPGRCIT